MTLFLLASLPQFVRPDSADPHARMWLPGMVFLVLGALLDVGRAFVGGAPSRWLRRRPRAVPRRHRVVGGVYLTLGVLGAAAALPVGP
ncbi:hypothetical protein [Streptomyces sp. NPDC056491]|uniref:hypothetical protein n=1 Tax=Streptomyces sp. NPDC056491 TaxID=3345837 RepID=UPI0036A16263